MSTVDSFGNTALHFAARNGELEAVQYLADFIPIDIKNTNLQTACESAERLYFNSRIVSFLKNMEKMAMKKAISNTDPICLICFDKLDVGNWGLKHGENIHAGYCESCAKTLHTNHAPCPQCRATIEAVFKVFT